MSKEFVKIKNTCNRDRKARTLYCIGKEKGISYLY